MKNALKTALAFSFVVLAGTFAAHAQIRSVPEVDPALGASAFTLLAGATMVLRSRKR